jgi:DNA-binding NarL/FixJ family response regulator
MSKEVRIVVADDHPILRKGLMHAIDGHPRLRVVAEAGDGEAALQQIEALGPDVAVLDIEMPKRDGFAVVRELTARRIEVAVIFLTLHDDEDLFNEAIDLGVGGYILKESALTGIVDGVTAVAAGQHYVTPSLTGLLLARRARNRQLAAEQPGLGALTPAEQRILRMIACGQSSKEIAAQLFIHHRTVENHRFNVAQKLGLQGHNSVLKFAMQHRSALQAAG